MGVILENLKKIKFIPRRGSLLGKAVLLSVVVFSTVTMLVMGSAVAQSRQRAEDLRQSALALEQEQQDLQNRIDDLGTDEAVRQIAQEELGLVDPDTVIIIPVE
jgi:cell division protein FtsL